MENADLHNLVLMIELIGISIILLFVLLLIELSSSFKKQTKKTTALFNKGPH